MKTTDIIRRAGRNLKRAKMRTFLTSVAIAVGGFAIMASLMAGEGARQYVDRILSSNIDPKGLMISRDEKMMGANSGGGSRSGIQEYNSNSMSAYGTDYKAITQADIDKLRQRSDITNVEPLYQLQPKFVEFSTQPDKKYIASLSMRDSSLRQEVLAGKEMPKGAQLADGEAMIPEGYLETLGKSAEQIIGSNLTVTVQQQPKQVSNEELAQVYAEKGEAGVKALIEGKLVTKTFKIVSIVKKSANSIASSPSISINPNAARELSEISTEGTDSYQKYLSVMATVTGDNSPEVVKEALKKDGFVATTAKEMQGLLFSFVNTLQGVVMGFGALALLVSIFGIINTMYISVLERTQQIGLMKALGASGRDIGRLFRYEAAWVGFLGGTLGVLAAWGVGTALNPWISETIGLGEHSLLIFQPVYAAVVVLVLIAVAVIAGLLPSRKAAKLDPIEALRTE